MATGSGPSAVSQANPTNGQFRVLLPEGKYTVRCHGQEQSQIFLPAATYHLDLRPGHTLDFEISKLSYADGKVRIRVSVRGDGTHRFSIRTENLALADAHQELIFKPGSVDTLEWSGRITSLDTPWVAVVIVDGNPTIRKELMGAAWEL
jgi:hypothetical protein